MKKIAANINDVQSCLRGDSRSDDERFIFHRGEINKASSLYARQVIGEIDG